MKADPANAVLVAWHRFGPYHHARLRAAAVRLPIVGLEMSTVDPVNAWTPVEGARGFSQITAFPGEDADRISRRRLAERLRMIFDEVRPRCVVVHGWSSRSALALMAASAARGIPIVIMSESTEIDAPRRWYKEVVKRRVLANCCAALVGGTAHRNYILLLGGKSDRIYLGYDVVDNEHFFRGAAKARANDAKLRRELGLAPKYFLASARFVEKKNLVRLLEAFASYRNRVGAAAWDLVVLGDGILRQEIEAVRDRLALQGCVMLPGFKQYDALPIWYGLASGFVHASTVEQWGLVVNEAMAAGLPVIVSKKCGCAYDLVQEGVNGFTFSPYDTDSLAQLMSELSRGDMPLDVMGRASSQIIARWGPERFAFALAAAVERSQDLVVTARDCLLLRTLVTLQEKGERYV